MTRLSFLLRYHPHLGRAQRIAAIRAADLGAEELRSGMVPTSVMRAALDIQDERHQSAAP